MKRMGTVIGIRPDMIDDYKRLHAAVWPDVLAAIRRANMRNYTIFCANPRTCCFPVLSTTAMTMLPI